jgi:hypothetical protein
MRRQSWRTVNSSPVGAAGTAAGHCGRVDVTTPNGVFLPDCETPDVAGISAAGNRSSVMKEPLTVGVLTVGVRAAAPGTAPAPSGPAAVGIGPLKTAMIGNWCLDLDKTSVVQK